MKRWKLNEENKSKNIKNINFQESNDYYINVLKINQNEFFTLSSDDGIQIFILIL